MAKKQAAARAAVPEVVESPELAPVTTEGAAISSFIANIVPFFRTAQQLEERAKETKARALALVAPATADEDAAIQTFIKGANTARRAIDEHWSICQTFFSLHRKLTTARGRGLQLLEDAASRAQGLHNTYAEAERRRAAEEQERLRREAEDRARADREAEARRLEEQAVRLEEASPDLSDRETLFVEMASENYPGGSQTWASRAGFKEPVKAAARLMSLAKIQKAIQARQDAAAAREQAAAKREQPLDVRVDEVKPNLVKAAGAHDRTTHSARVLDKARLIAAVIEGGYGIPHDVLMVNEAKVNEYARSLQERINLWPGVQHVKSTKTI